MFSERKGTTLPPRRPYDNRIDLEDGTSPPSGPIYSLSKVEQLVLRSLSDENLANKFIRPSVSRGALIPFIKNRDSSLRLTIDYCGLNYITKKD